MHSENSFLAGSEKGCEKVKNHSEEQIRSQMASKCTRATFKRKKSSVICQKKRKEKSYEAALLLSQHMSGKTQWTPHVEQWLSGFTTAEFNLQSGRNLFLGELLNQLEVNTQTQTQADDTLRSGLLKCYVVCCSKLVSWSDFPCIIKAEESEGSVSPHIVPQVCKTEAIL